jgi:hypothetical protein
LNVTLTLLVVAPCICSQVPCEDIGYTSVSARHTFAFLICMSRRPGQQWGLDHDEIAEYLNWHWVQILDSLSCSFLFTAMAYLVGIDEMASWIFADSSSLWPPDEGPPT